MPVLLCAPIFKCWWLPESLHFIVAINKRRGKKVKHEVMQQLFEASMQSLPQLPATLADTCSRVQTWAFTSSFYSHFHKGARAPQHNTAQRRQHIALALSCTSTSTNISTLPPARRHVTSTSCPLLLACMPLPLLPLHWHAQQFADFSRTLVCASARGYELERVVAPHFGVALPTRH